MPKIKAISYKCNGCGNDMIFNPDQQCLTCKSCNSVLPIKTSKGLPKHNLDENLAQNSDVWAKQVNNMSCPNCGANVLLNKFQTSARCPYCDSALLAKRKNNAGLKPDAVVPFKISKQKAEMLFKENMSKKPFVSSSFKNSIKADEIHGYYIPSFLFDAECSSKYDAKLYETYTVKDQNGFQETKTKYLNINGTYNSSHKNIEIEASTKLTQLELNSIKPFNLGDAKIYSDQFIFGYGLECYSSSANECASNAKNIIKTQIKNGILSHQKYDGVEYFNLHTTYNQFKYCYCLLPIYRINYSHNNKQYSNIMNGQTGAIAGKYPKSKLKVAISSFLLSLIIIVPVLLFILFAFNII